MCEHDWEIKGDKFSFRCKLCDVLGYRSVRGYGFSGHRNLKTGNIVPYKCAEPSCKKDASFISWNSKLRYCSGHENPRNLSLDSREYLDVVAKEDKRIEEVNAKAFEELRRIREEVM